MSAAYEPVSVEEQEEPSPVYPAHQDQPPIYFGEGPFSAPSSVDDPDEHMNGKEDGEKDEDGQEAALLQKGAEVGGDEEMVLGPRYPDKPRSPLRYLVIALILLLGTAVAIGSIAASSYRPGSRAVGRKAITMDHVFNGTFGSRGRTLRWVPEAGDGVYAEPNPRGDIELHDLNRNTTRILLKRGTIYDTQGRQISWDDFKVSPDMRYILLKTNWRKQWRHSGHANYYIHSLLDNTTRSLTPPTSPPLISYATWSPTGESLAYILSNDLYVLPNPSPLTAPIRVTTDGNSSIFNAVPDWVYEEEVFGGDSALWWSPDSRRIAYLRLDETAVNNYTYPVYNPTNNAEKIQPYTSFMSMKYPKPGFSNPIVSAHLFDLSEYDRIWPDDTTRRFDLSWESSLAPEDKVIQEVVWVSNGSLLIKEVNRAADMGRVVLFEIGENGGVPTSREVRTLGKEGEQSDGGWIDPEQRVRALFGVPGYTPGAYIDILPTPEGYNHLALFPSADASEPRWLTTGAWEVTDGILAVDAGGHVYFQAAHPSSTERHIYSVSLPPASALSSPATPPGEPTSLTSTQKPAYFTASFSPHGGYYQLNYEGPDVPWQELHKVGNDSFTQLLENNEALNKTSAEYAMPVITHSTVTIDGFEMNAIELRPPGMDDSGKVKYPVLFRVYGGPFSQTVSYRWQRDWHHYLCTTLRYIVVVVDGRGTGFKGRALRNPVRGQLGVLEARDQVEAARAWVAKGYVDKHRVGIWGWSYGGFMTCKVLETGSGVYTLGMAVAPVTDWRLYDSIYTERYMLTPAENTGGYDNSSIHDVKPFAKADFLLAHGSGDDNVHFANSAHLLDELTSAGVRGFRFRMFTDSDHGIGTRGAFRELYEWMTAFLVEKWGTGGVKRP